MTEFSNDDSRLRAAEEQMRRALGLRDQASAPQPPTGARTVQSPNGPHRPHRRFVREGEVPVEVVHHESAGTNQLEVARQAIRALTTSRDQAERQLAEAQNSMRDLQTKLAHERIARDEAVQRASAKAEDFARALQETKLALETERAARRAIEEQLAGALEHIGAKRHAEQLEHSFLAPESRDSDGAEGDRAGVTEQTDKPVRRRGRPPRAKPPEMQAEFVEWWKPGWQEQFR